MSETKDVWVDGDIVRVTTKTGEIGIGYCYMPQMHIRVLVGCLSLGLKKPAMLLPQKHPTSGNFVDKVARMIMADGYVYSDDEIKGIEVLQPRGVQ